MTAPTSRRYFTMGDDYTDLFCATTTPERALELFDAQDITLGIECAKPSTLPGALVEIQADRAHLIRFSWDDDAPTDASSAGTLADLALDEVRVCGDG